ncbi:TPA: Lar family restriction alleviation protein [Burkholderia vietnamiensis]|jgi:hypothetical protein|uniref:Lar family restriction alleviation protein n=1 Tax=Burkholderia vietnamiensis TaxID=60552 RepID=UPI00075A0E71|nr:Lar family restriction alleviation protein [Burkholderia vietnamiensis]KVR89977.1 hypothetical protein WK28_23275 [Burkholderia vietnamiensis]MBR7974456.1 Lar family restriction alleviation protein [Burkholderia vietnamiensis]MCA8183504.1 Lar family restriction alleviation protein [Burkholderia vietnamiensis]HDR9180717.1 Lar family restriction alleviation protein [Burkholderia vietnamiensis]
MLEHLYPCGHCGERPRIGRSQRLIDCEENRLYDYSTFGRYAGPPEIGDVLPRPPEAPKTEKLVCIYCTGCGMQTPWEPVDEDDLGAKNRCFDVWNNRLNRPKLEADDLRTLIEREIGACDSQMVIDLLSRADGDWTELGPIFKMLAQRLVDATIVTIDAWPISPVLEDAARYRKLVQLAKWIEIDGHRYVQFPKIASPLDHNDGQFEERIAVAVDAMPDRDRW